MAVMPNVTYISNLSRGPVEHTHLCPDDYRKFYKTPSSKVASNRNTYSLCGLIGCLRSEREGQPRFPVCAKCKRVRYCSREHQVENWPLHKDVCRRYRDLDTRDGILAGQGVLTESQYVNDLLRDFVQLHDSTIHQLANTDYHRNYEALVKDNMDFQRLQVEIYLKYRGPECGGDPTKAFQIERIGLTEVGKNSYTQIVKRYREIFTENRKNDPDFIQVLMCHYYVQGYESVSRHTGLNHFTWVAIYKNVDPFKVSPRWRQTMVDMLGAGLVLRKVEVKGRRNGVWKVGGVIPRNGGWQWVELTPAVRATCPVEVPPVGIWLRPKVANVICTPDGTPWEAPVDYPWDD